MDECSTVAEKQNWHTFTIVQDPFLVGACDIVKDLTMMRKKRSETVISFVQAYPELVSFWHPTRNEGISPDAISFSSHRLVWWQCDRRATHVWEESLKVFTRPKKGGKCPYCDNRRVLLGENDLATTHPDLAAQWHPNKNGNLTPTNCTARSAQTVTWLGNCGHEWKSQVSVRALRSHGCPYCSGRWAMAGFNDLATTHPELIAEWHPTKNTLSLHEVSRGSVKKVWWQCAVDPSHEWEATPNSRTNNKTGCPVCSGHKVLAGFSDFGTTHPHLLDEWHPTKNGDLLPTVISQAGRYKVWWICAAGHEWRAQISGRANGHGCPRCSKMISKAEIEISEVIASWGFEVVSNNRSVLGSGTELDIYIPEKKFAIEFNGLYWHSEKFKKRTKHQQKQQACAQVGITLYQVWEDDWKHRRQIVLRGIAHRLGVVAELRNTLDIPAYYTERIGGRRTKIVALDYKQAAAFLDEHHIQGAVTGSYYFGLNDDKSRLRAVLVIKKTGKPGELSIERYATAGTVAGGFTKLLRHAEKTLKPCRWVTFADLSVSDGGLYEKTGFVVDAVLPPDYSYVVQGRRVHKFNYRIARFKKDSQLLYQEGLSERELAELNGLYRVWDSGKIRYVKDLSPTAALSDIGRF